jgi:hypothetical protein
MGWGISDIVGGVQNVAQTAGRLGAGGALGMIGANNPNMVKGGLAGAAIGGIGGMAAPGAMIGAAGGQGTGTLSGLFDRTTGQAQPGQPAPNQASGPNGIQTPAEAAASRNADISAGQANWRTTVNDDPRIKDILNRRQDLSQGLNAQELRAQREQTARNIGSQQQGAMRQLYSAQANKGIRGGMAGAQAARVQRQAMQDRQAAEQKNTLDNMAVRRQGLNDYAQMAQGLKFGEMQQGLGQAGLGVADRTGYQQALIGQSMAAAAGQQPKRGILGQVLGDLF